MDRMRLRCQEGMGQSVGLLLAGTRRAATGGAETLCSWHCFQRSPRKGVRDVEYIVATFRRQPCG